MSTQAKIAIEQAKTAAQRGDYTRARAILREASKLDPNNVEIFLVFAKVAQKREHAIQCYQRVLEIDPYNPIAHEALEHVQAQREARQAVAARAQAALPKRSTLSRLFSPLGKIPFKGMLKALVRIVLLLVVIVAGGYLGFQIFNKAREVTGFTPLGVASKDTPSPTVITNTPTPEVIVPELQPNYVGRLFIQSGDPAEQESAWDLISIDGFNQFAFKTEDGRKDWYEAEVRMRISFERSHLVKFRITIKNPSTNRLTPVQLEEMVLPNDELGLGRDAIQSMTLGFSQWSTGEVPPRQIEVIDVVILRIDDQRKDEWMPPEGGPGQFRDIWIISNPHDTALPISWEISRQNAEGETTIAQEYGFCTQTESDQQALYQEFSLLPPGESFVISHDMSLEEAQSGMTTELKMHTLADCRPLVDHDVTYDKDVVLTMVVEEGNEIALIVENRGSKEALGLFFVNIYDQDDNPIAGRVVTLDPSNFPILPDEILELIMPIDFIGLVKPAPSSYDFVFLGLSGGTVTVPPTLAPLEVTATATEQP
ncbi:MAG: hypothetical protein GTO14_00060 [Anaerolineales bacterium]|nr:hypothetical protein [Anaerolineales bacterium]